MILYVGVVSNQYESAYFPAPYADNNCFQQPQSVVQSGVRPLILRASTQQLGLAVGRSTSANSPQNLHQKRSQKVRNPKFPWGGNATCPQTSLAGFTILDPPLRCIT